ncbi:MAG: hypothetical protein ACYDCC_04405 [Actinomycetota bacterium]
MRRATVRARIIRALLVCALALATACTSNPSSVGAANPGASLIPSVKSKGATGTATAPTVVRRHFKNPQLFPTYTPSSAIPPQPPGTVRAPLQASMGSLCVQPGETQTITIKTRDNYFLAWAVFWPDQKAHQEWGAWQTTQMNKTTDPGGVHHASFVIPPNAPTGRARTDIAVSGAYHHQSEQASMFVFWEIELKC